MTDRREFLKSLLGVAAGAALPAPLEALVDKVALPGERKVFLLTLWIKVNGDVFSFPPRICDTPLTLSLCGRELLQVSIPLRATYENAMEKTRALMLEAYEYDVQQIQLEALS